MRSACVSTTAHREGSGVSRMEWTTYSARKSCYVAFILTNNPETATTDCRDMGDVHNDNPAEEVNIFDKPGAFYGYPYCWYDHFARWPKVQASVLTYRSPGPNMI